MLIPCAVKLQGTFRASRARKYIAQFRVKTEAALKIQSFYRAIVGRRELLLRSKECSEAETQPSLDARTDSLSWMEGTAALLCEEASVGCPAHQGYGSHPELLQGLRDSQKGADKEDQAQGREYLGAPDMV